MNALGMYNVLLSQVRLLTVIVRANKESNDNEIELRIDAHPEGDFVRIETGNALVHIRFNKDSTESFDEVWNEEYARLSVRGTNKEKLVIDAIELSTSDNWDMPNPVIQNNLHQVSRLLSIFNEFEERNHPLEHRDFSPGVKKAIQICGRLKNHFNVE